jgi:uncharacterized protein (TIGR03083 family)
MSDIRTVFLEILPAVRPLLADERTGGRWAEESALSGMTTGGLAGHLYRAALTVELYLDRPAPSGEPLIDAAQYFNLALNPDRGSAGNQAVVQRAEQEGAVGQETLLAAFDATAARLQQRLPAEPADRQVRVIGDRCLTLDQYLRTRLVELVVHADDLAASIGAELTIPHDAASETAAVLTELAILRHGPSPVIRALARRERHSGGVFPVV